MNEISWDAAISIIILVIWFDAIVKKAPNIEIASSPKQISNRSNTKMTHTQKKNVLCDFIFLSARQIHKYLFAKKLSHNKTNAFKTECRKKRANNMCTVCFAEKWKKNRKQLQV